MEIFEVHITSGHRIHQVGCMHGHKTIAIDLLQPNGKFLREENMTSIIMKYDDDNNFQKCKKDVLAIAKLYESVGLKLNRVKIESPLYERYVEQSLYMESHFPATNFDLPISRNQKKLTFLATDRTHNHSDYDAFAKKYEGKELELCLYDTNMYEDKDWLGLWDI